MFNLIITVAAVALVIVLMIAVMYYGGSETLTQGQQEAVVAQALNEVGQIKAAMVSFKAHEGADPSALSDLIPQYLSTMPDGWGVEVPGAIAFDSSKLSVGTDAQKLVACTEVNVRLGHSGSPPNCSEIEATFTGCCVAPDDDV